jgi:predicted nucleotidyltransferase
VSSIGYAGSYARGNWGVGSDVDLIILVTVTEAALTERARSFDATRLPVPADVLVYTEREWARMDGENRLGPTVWVATRDGAASPSSGYVSRR